MFNNKFYVFGDQNVQVPSHLNFGKYILDRLRQIKNEVAIENAETGEKLTYKELTEYAIRLSVAFTRLGVRKGDVVALGSEKRLMFVPTALAIIFSGATYTAYDFDSGRAPLHHKLSISQPKYFICTDLFWKTNHKVLEIFECIKTLITLDEAPPNMISVDSLISGCNVDTELFEPVQVQGQVDTAVIFYSSGTTGMPKGIQLTHLNCFLNCLPHDFGDDSINVSFVTGDWYHNYEAFMTYKLLSLGMKILYNDEINPTTVLDVYVKHKINLSFVIPSFLNWLSKLDYKKDYDLESLKVIYCGSAPLHVKTLEKLKQRFPSIKSVLQDYGTTETGWLTSERWGSKGPRPGSVGGAFPGTTLKVVDPETLNILGPNEKGEIYSRGPALMKGYINVDPSSYLDEDGFFRTGDLGYYDEDGYFYIIDRLKEIIIYDGYNIAPAELEAVLMLHPEVREAGVVGKPIPDDEEPTAFVVRQPGSDVTEKQLIDFVAAEVAPYMQLKGGIRFISKLPTNPRGKLLRRQLREMLAQE